MQINLGQIKRNKILNKMIIAFIIIMVLCTYFSRTINNMLLPKVTLVTLKPGVIGDGYQAQGNLSYDTSQAHNIITKSDWVLKEILVKENQIVKKGQRLASIDNDDLTIKEKDEQLAILKLTNALSSSTDNTKDLNISAPFSGQISDIKVSAGSVIPAGSVVMSIKDPSKLKLTLNFRSDDAARFKTGQSVDVMIETLMQSIKGRISYIGNQPVPLLNGGKVVNVEIQLKNPGALVAGMKASASVKISGTTYESTDDAQLDYITKQDIMSVTGGTVESVSVKENQAVKSGDMLVKLNNTDVTKAAKQNSNNVSETKLQLAEEKIKYKKLREGLTKDGYIVADMDGRVVNVNQTAQSGQAILSIIGNKPNYCISWNADSDDADTLNVSDKVNVFVNISKKGDDEERDISVSAKITDKTLDKDTGEYKFTATLEGNHEFREGEKATVTTSDSSKNYNKVIPKSCLVEEGGNDFIYVAVGKDGALGGKILVQKLQVSVVAADEQNCAIKQSDNNQIPDGAYGIVSDTTKPLSDNVEVNILNQSY